MISTATFDRVMQLFADRLGRALEPETLEAYRAALSESGLTDDEFLAAAGQLFRGAKYWNDVPPEAFAAAADVARRKARQAQLASRALRSGGRRAATEPTRTLAGRGIPQLDDAASRRAVCACGDAFVQSPIAAAYLERCDPDWRRTLAALYPENHVPHRCPRCERRAALPECIAC